MKSYLFTAVIFISVAYQNCKKSAASSASTIPVCIQAKIDSLKNLPKQNPPAQVDEYSYKGKRVFVFSAPCCDQYNQAFDEACNYLCAPSGGLTGRGDGKCVDFKDSAKFVKQVWRDER